MMEIPKNAAVGQTDLFVSICFSSATPGHWQLTFLSVSYNYIQISLCLKEYGAIDSDIWPLPTKNCLQDDSSIQRGATKKGQPQASLRAPERRKTSGVLLKKDPDMHKERAIENRHHGGDGWIASWRDVIWLEPGKFFVLFVDVYENQEPDTHRVPDFSLKYEYGEALWVHTWDMTFSETALPQEQQVGQVLRLLEILIWKDSELQALLRREGRAFSDLVASLQQEGSSGSDLLQASKRWSCMLSLLQFWHPVSRTSLRIQQDSRFSTSYNDYQLRHSIKWTVYMFYSITF